MALTPEEIVNYDLRQSVRGYSVSQVDDLLDRLADQVETAESRIEELTERLRRAEEQLAEANETDATLKRTLVAAQRTAERAVADAEEEARDIVSEAHREAEELHTAALEEYERAEIETRERLAKEVEQARQQRSAIEERIDAMLSRERQVRERLRRDLKQQLAELDGGSSQGEPESSSPLTVRVHGTSADEPSAPLGSAARDER